MLTSLDFLNKGEIFPPKCEHERLEMYHYNKELFEGEHAEVYKEALKRIERVIGNYDDVKAFPVIINYQKIESLKIADLLFGEPPKITADDTENVKAQLAIDTIIKKSDLMNTAYETAIDVSRFGDGLFLIVGNKDDAKIDVTQPKFWFPVVNPDNVREIIYHVLAWVYETVENTEKKEYLKVRIHSKGSYEERVYLIKNKEIDREVKARVTVPTFLNDFAIVQVCNIKTSDRVTGIDDYSDIDSLVSELIIRIGQISKILDKHASPSMSGPSSAIETDPQTGEGRVKAGNYYQRDSSDDPKPEYITWDGQLEANFKQIEKLTNELYTKSEMGGAIFGDLVINGNITSAKQLKLTMNSVLAKVNRVRMRFDPAIKKAIKLCSQLGGENIIDLTDIPITITWQDGLPTDDKELAEIMQIRTGNKATISQQKAIEILDSKDKDSAEEELARIQEDEAMIDPLNTTKFSNQ